MGTNAGAGSVAGVRAADRAFSVGGVTRYELAMSQSIISSARLSRRRGIAMRSGLAVLSLMTNSNLGGSMAGDSAGRARRESGPRA
jgi:hypothetical protein